MKKVKKMQAGGKATKDSTAYFKDEAKDNMNLAVIKSKYGLRNEADKNMKTARESLKSASRQSFKGKPGYDKDGYPIKKKMQAGGVAYKKVKAPMVDPKGAFTKVQERTIAGKKMAKTGMKIPRKK